MRLMTSDASRRKSPGKQTRPIRLMLVDDHPMWRDTVRKVLEPKRFATIVAEASDGSQAVALAKTVKPEVVLMDIGLPVMNGIEATRTIAAERPAPRVLVLASSDERAQVLAAVAAGASGYLLKTAGPNEVRDAVGRIHAGELVFPPALANVVLDEVRRSSGVSGAPQPAPTSEEATFRREGEYWTIGWEGQVFRLKDQKGLSYLAHLLAHPGREFHVLELAALSEGAAPDDVEVQHRAASSGLRARRLEDAGEILDEEAKAAYRRRLAELEEELEDARQWGNADRAERAQEEIDALARELASAVGLGGRDRTFASPAERARVNLTRAIRATIDRIAKNSPPMGRHLNRAIRTGTFCSYAPNRQAAPRWQL